MEASNPNQSSRSDAGKWQSMKSPLKKFIEITQNIIIEATDVPVNQRDHVVLQIENMLTERENVLAEIKPPFSSEDLDLSESLPTINKQLDEAMRKLQKEVQKDLQEIEAKKTSYKKYINPYEAAEANDGAFYDKRK